MRTVYGQEGHIWIPCVDGDSSKAGLWRSTNSGVSFTKISGVQNAQSIGFGRTASGSGHPALYMGGQVNNTWGIFRSEDLATNWIRINDDQHQYGGISQITGDPKIYGRCYFGGRGLRYGDISNAPQVTKMIYQDSLVDGWENWSWATTDTASATPARRGTSAISVTADAWAALSLHRQAVQSTVGYSAVAFWIHGGQSGGQPLQVVSLRNGNTQVFKPIPPPLAGTWTRVVIPLSELGLANVSDFDGLWIQNSSGSPISTFHVDDIALVGEADAKDWTTLDWESWRQSQFTASELADDGISGLGADPDHDGVPNRIEWLLLGSAIENNGGPWCSWQLADGAVALTYARRAGFPTAMTLETSTNLEDWQPATGVSQVLPLDASGLSERVSWSIPTMEPRLFLRLK